MVTRRYIVKGRVQGVGFRAFLQKRARSCGLMGWVRNLRDGRVEALAHGPLGDLERWEVYVRRGPESGRVEQMELQEVFWEGQLLDFNIVEDGVSPWTF